MLVNIAAKWIDDIRHECNCSDHHLKGNIQARLISTTVFPLFAAIDTVDQTALTLKDLVCLDLTHAKEHAILARKCFDGFLFSPLSLIYSDICSRHFIPKREEAEGVVRPNGQLYAIKVEEIKPETVEEVQRIVKEAGERKGHVTVAGARFSQGKQILPSKPGQVLLDMTHPNFKKIEINGKIARVGAGVVWKELQAEAIKKGLAVQVQQASNVFSITGSISAPCHGWDHTMGTIGNTVKSLTVVDGLGNLRKLSLTDPDPEVRDMFKCVVGGFGMFGVIVEAELELTTNDVLVETGEKVEFRDYLPYFDKQVAGNSDVKMHLYRLSLDPSKGFFKEGYAQNYSKVGEPPKSPADIVPEPEYGERMPRILFHAVRRFRTAKSLFWANAKSEILGTRELDRNHAMAPPILATVNNSKTDAEWLQEFFVKREDLEEFIKVLGKTLDKNQVKLLNASVRYIKPDHTCHLSYARKVERFAIVLFFTQELSPKEIAKTRAWVRKTIDYLQAKGGTYYLPYQHFATKEQFRKCYPQWTRVVYKKRKYDPNDVFHTGLYEDYFKTKRKIVLKKA